MLTIPEVNAMPEQAFLAAFGGVVESSPWVAQLVYQASPFPNTDGLVGAFTGTLHGLDEDRQLDVIRAHPDLVGRAALAGSLTPDSTSEQASAGLNQLTPQEIEQFQALNQAYWQQFGFPFVICVRENKKQAIVDGMQTRLRNTKRQEIATAIDEICKIVSLRLLDRVFK